MMSPLLDINFLQNNLRNTFPDQLFGIDILDSIDSTNRYLIEKNTENIHICLAEQQTAGRGRQGKTWFSPFGVNIYCSLLWPFFKNPSETEGLSLLIGIIVARTLKKYGVDQLKLKWPNDILCQNKKIAGVLIETTNKNNRYNTIIGVGINVFLSSVIPQIPTAFQAMARRKHSRGAECTYEHMSTETSLYNLVPAKAGNSRSLKGEGYKQINQAWTDIASEVNFQPDRNQLTLHLLVELFKTLRQFELKGFSIFHSEWDEYDLLHDQSVTLQTHNSMIEGIARGVNEQGHLQLEISSKIESFACGEIIKARLR